MQAEQFQLNFNTELEHWWFVARRGILRSLISQILPASRDTLVVDVGCGTGGNIASLCEDYTCVGIDPSSEAIELARSRFSNVRFIRGQAPDDLGDAAPRAKLFMLTDMLEHVPDDFAVLSSLLAAASPGAYFLLTVPADLSLWSVHDENHGHYRRYDKKRFERLWRNLPVTVCLLSYFNSRLYPVVKLARAVSRRRKRAGGEAGTDVKMPPRLINRALERIFGGEGKTLNDLLGAKRQRGYRFGVSLVALLRREEGEIVPRRKPPDVAADYYDPQAGRIVAAGV